MLDEKQNPDRWPLGSPGWEYLQANGCRYDDDPDADKRFRALMKAADCLWYELVAIRHFLENGKPYGTPHAGGAERSGSPGSEHKSP